MLLREFGLSLFLEGTPPTRLQKNGANNGAAAVVLAKIQGILGERTWAHGESAWAQRASATDWRGDRALEAEVLPSGGDHAEGHAGSVHRERQEASGGTETACDYKIRKKAACTPRWCS